MSSQISQEKLVTLQRQNTMALPLLFLYFLLSGIYWVASSNTESIAGRVGPADIFMLGLGTWVIIRSKFRLRLPTVVAPLVGLFSVALLSATNSLSLGHSVVALLIFAGNIFSFLIVFHIISGLDDFDRMESLRLFALSGGMLAAFGVYDVLSHMTPLPIVPRPFGYEGTDAGVTGTFRNSGQAGSFYFLLYLVSFAVSLVPGRPGKGEASKLAPLVLPSTVMLAMALLLTAKRAGIIGAAIGTLLLVLRNGPKRSLTPRFVLATACLAIAGVGYAAVADVSEAIRRRREFKAQTAEGILDEDGFWISNLRDGLIAFSQFPVLGTGLGGAGEHTRTGHEIHSTYVAVITEMGLAGSIVYVLFMATLIVATYRSRSNCKQARHFSALSPAIWIGVLVALIYMTHLRKREFWSMAAVLCAVASPSISRTGGSGMRSKPAIRNRG